MASKRKIQQKQKQALKEPKTQGYGGSYYDAKEEKNFLRNYLPGLISVLVLLITVTIGPEVIPPVWNRVTTTLEASNNPLFKGTGNVLTVVGDTVVEVYTTVVKETADKTPKIDETSTGVLNGTQGEPGVYEIVERVNLDNDDAIIHYTEIPPYTGSEEIIELNDNQAGFTEQELNTKQSQTFSKLDHLKRPGQANALLTPSMQPTETRESISSVTPPGWKHGSESNNQRVVLKKGRKAQWFYDRSHLIGFQLGGVNAEAANLVTGARTFNDPNMKIYETVVDDAIEAGFTIRYQVTPIYNQEELVPRGVQMRAYSLDDTGAKVNYNVFIYNVNPGYNIDYTTGEIISN